MAGSPPTLNGEVAHASATGVSVSTITLTLTADTVGSLIVVGIGLDAGRSVSSATDSRGNTYNTGLGSVVGTTRGGLFWSRLDYPLKIGDTITLTLSGAATNWASVALDYSNAHLTSNGVDGQVSGQGTSTAPASGNTASTTIADEIVIGFTLWQSANTTDYSSAGAGFTQRGTKTVSGTFGIALEDKTVSATGVQASSATLGTSLGWIQVTICVRGSKTWYVDYSKADDTGAGTSFGVAKKNLSALTLLTGDTVHMAKSSDPAAQAGTMTFTDNSTSVATSSDLTGTLAAKDMVGPYTGSELVTGDGWWEISSITSSTITLASAYTGTTRTTVTGYKFNGFDAGAVAVINTQVVNNGSSGNLASPIQIIGGYDTSNDTRTGITFLRGSGATRNGQFGTANDHQIWSYFGNARLNNGWTSISRVEIRHCTFNAAQNAVVTFNGSGNSSTSIMDSFLITCPIGAQAAITGATGVLISNGRVEGVNNVAFTTSSGQEHQVLDTVTIRRVSSGSSVTLSGAYTTLRNCTITFSNQFGVNATNYGRYRIEGCTFSNNTSGDVRNAAGAGTELVVFNCTLSSATPLTAANLSIIQCDRYNATAGSWRTSDANKGLILSNTGQARTGTCVELQPNVAVGTNRAIACQYATPIAVDDSGGTRTVTVYVQTTAAWNGTFLRVGLRQYFNWVSGQWQDLYSLYGLPVLSAGWTAYTFTFTPMNERGAIDLCVECDGTAGSVYIDDVSYT